MKNFKKIVLTIMLGILVLLPSAVYAKTEVKTEEELKTATKNGGDIVLQNDITLKSALEIKGSNVIIDLNGKTITVDENGYFDLFEGKLEFTGTGKIKDIRVRDITSTIWDQPQLSRYSYSLYHIPALCVLRQYSDPHPSFVQPLACSHSGVMSCFSLKILIISLFLLFLNIYNKGSPKI